MHSVSAVVFCILGLNVKIFT